MILPQKNLAEILVYKRKVAPFLGRDLSTSHSTVSHDTSRKQFFAKLAGLAAAVAVVPKVLAKSAPVAPAAPVNVRPETRAVARRADSV
jgi:hypothetical protein